MRLIYVVLSVSVGLLFAASPALAHSDTEPPVLIAFDFNPKTIDVTEASQSVICTMSFTDSPAGISGTSCTFRSPTSGQQRLCNGALVSGNIHSGTWQCTVNFEPLVEEGVWTPDVHGWDGIGNHRNYFRDDLVPLGFPTELNVTSGEDVSGPSLVGFDFNPKTIDVTEASQSVICTMSFTDSPAGISGTSCTFRSPTSGQQRLCNGALVSGNIHSGTWQCTVNFEPLVEEGVWTPDVHGWDGIGNHRNYFRDDLVPLGFPTELNVTSGEDVSGPSLVGFDFNPKTIDVTEASQSVICTMSFTDSPAGISGTSCTFRSPTSGQQRLCNGALVSGNIHSGTWQCTVNFEPLVEEGVWTPDVHGWDGIGNHRNYFRDDLVPLGFPTELNIGFVQGTPAAVVASPRDSQRLGGTSVTVRARLIQGGPSDVSASLGVRFDYRPLPSGSFSPIPARNANHPNPDTAYPYFIHWDVSQVADGDYELRAVAHDVASVPDPSPQAVMITVDHAGPADVDEYLNAEGRQESLTKVDDSVESKAASGDCTDTNAATQLIIPAGALYATIDTARLFYPNPTTEVPKLEEQDQSLGIFVDVSLESGQTTFASGFDSDLNISYSDSNADGLVDGTSFRENELELRRYDVVSDSYLIVPATIMTEHNMIYTDTAVTGRFAVTGPQLLRVQFEADRQTLSWGSIAAASRYNVYRGDLAGLVDLNGDDLPDGGYGECQNFRDANLADTTFVDDDAPSPGAGFAYLVSFVDSGVESSLGNTRAGMRRMVNSPCP